MFNVKTFTEGAVKLSFEPTLTLKDVQMENKAVAKGEYEPPDCSARQSVAILIPQRSRERHLLYLMHHLHPFLQRQQLHYAIYVIQQVLLKSSAAFITTNQFRFTQGTRVIFILCFLCAKRLSLT